MKKNKKNCRKLTVLASATANILAEELTCEEINLLASFLSLVVSNLYFISQGGDFIEEVNENQII